MDYLGQNVRIIDPNQFNVKKLNSVVDPISGKAIASTVGQKYLNVARDIIQYGKTGIPGTALKGMSRELYQYARNDPQKVIEGLAQGIAAIWR